MSYRLTPISADSESVLKSFHITLPGRPKAAAVVDQASVESLRSAADLARVGLWPPPHAR
jgi:hypothetical protein